MDNAMNSAEIEELPIWCPECETRTSASVEEIDKTVEEHNRQQHDGKPVAGVHVVTRNSNVIAPTPQAIIDHLEVIQRMARRREGE